jgi:quercetin dioxygenase-like cupin family protein
MGSAPLDGTPQRGDRVLAAPLLTFDLRTELEELRRKPGYAAGEPTGSTLLKEPDLRIVLMALRAGGRMVEHRASGPISVQPIEGRFLFSLPDHSVELTAGKLLTLEPGIAHSVDAVEDSVFLLTIGRTTYRDVHDHHEPRG